MSFLTTTSITQFRNFITYSYVYYNCTQGHNGFRCKQVCESVWFKIYNATAATDYVQNCDKIFFKKYGDISYL